MFFEWTTLCPFCFFIIERSVVGITSFVLTTYNTTTEDLNKCNDDPPESSDVGTSQLTFESFRLLEIPDLRRDSQFESRCVKDDIEELKVC